MFRRRSVLLSLFLLLVLLISSGASVAAPLSDRPVHSFKVADPRARFASLARAGAENFMTLAGGSADSPLGNVAVRERFRLYSEYEAVFFPTAAGSATF